MSAGDKVLPQAPEWASAMAAGRWCRISGDTPDLGLSSTPVGTRFLADNDPARDPALNPPTSPKERLRRLIGRDWIASRRHHVGALGPPRGDGGILALLDPRQAVGLLEDAIE